MNVSANTGLDRAVWRVAAVVVVGSIMSILDTTVVNVALDALAHDLHSSIASIQWIVTGYLLALAAVIPLTAWAARRVGTKQLYLLSLVLFTVGSVLCGIAWSTGSLVVFRVIQGAGGGMLLPVGQMILARAAGPQRMGRVMSVIGIPIVLAPILGPVLGGLILDDLSWRWIFFINLPLGALALLLGLRLLPPGHSEPAGRIDALGFGLLGIGLPAFTYGLAEIGQGSGGASVRALVPVVAGIALVVGFVLHARRAPAPLLDLRLWASRAFAAASLTTLSLGAALFGGMILLPLYFQTVRGESALDTGLLLAPQGIGVGLAMPLAGRLADRIGGGRVALVGVVLMVLSTIPLAFVDEATSYVALAALLAARGFGIGVAMIPAMSAAYATLRPEQIGDAAPQLNVIQRVGGSIGTAIFAVVLERHIRHAGAGAGAHTLARAYAQTYWWVVAVTAAGLLPAALLARLERRGAASDARGPQAESAAA